MLPIRLRRDRDGHSGERFAYLIGARRALCPIEPPSLIASRDQTFVTARVSGARYAAVSAAVARQRKLPVVNRDYGEQMR
jgi:hypothetical protein